MVREKKMTIRKSGVLVCRWRITSPISITSSSDSSLFTVSASCNSISKTAAILCAAKLNSTRFRGRRRRIISFVTDNDSTTILLDDQNLELLRTSCPVLRAYQTPSALRALRLVVEPRHRHVIGVGVCMVRPIGRSCSKFCKELTTTEFYNTIAKSSRWNLPRFI